MAGVTLKALPPAEAVKFFRAKGFRIGFDWRDTWAAEHAHFFTVAKAMSKDVLADIRGALDEALAEGRTFDEFRRDLTPVLQKKGWWGKASVIDPLTGETVIAQLGSPFRLRTIFDVNVRTSFAAGRWERVERLRERRPWLRYSAVLDERTRPAHRAWHGTVLPIDDPWWATHYPPNGWRCRCTAIQLSDRDLERFDFIPSPRAPDSPTRQFRNKRTGEISDVPIGIDPGFAHNVGKAAAASPEERARRAGLDP